MNRSLQRPFAYLGVSAHLYEQIRRNLVGQALEARRADTARRLEELRRQLTGAAARADERACVYLTGSFGRGEASRHSDVDLFIVGRASNGKRALSKLDEICLKADLIEATRQLGFADFSGDGEYLTHHTAPNLVEKLGAPDDDAGNTLTARLLLLLESRPLIGDEICWETIKEAIAKYWRDYEDHKNDFVPAFLANDILRLWRTFCVNYEARTLTEPATKRAKRKLKNYKPKHSRLLTCYSGLVFLLATFVGRSTVSPDDALAMVRLTPTERLDWLRSEVRFRDSASRAEAILSAYEGFLSETDADEETLVARFMDPEQSRRYAREANQLGDLVYELLDGIGEKCRLYRLLVV